MTPQIYRHYQGRYCIAFGFVDSGDGQMVLYQDILTGKLHVMTEARWEEFVGPAMSGTRRFELVKPLPCLSAKGHTIVVHCKKAPYDIYIGRPSPWGNPYKVDNMSRDEAIEKYTQHLIEDPWLLTHIHELQDKVLGCFCSPEPCHGDILARLANAYNISASL